MEDTTTTMANSCLSAFFVIVLGLCASIAKCKIPSTNNIGRFDDISMYILCFISGWLCLTLLVFVVICCRHHGI